MTEVGSDEVPSWAPATCRPSVPVSRAPLDTVVDTCICTSIEREKHAYVKVHIPDREHSLRARVLI